jgi:hypothetical protein
MKEMECEERMPVCTSVSPLQRPARTQEPSREMLDRIYFSLLLKKKEKNNFHVYLTEFKVVWSA